MTKTDVTEGVQNTRAVQNTARDGDLATRISGNAHWSATIAASATAVAAFARSAATWSKPAPPRRANAWPTVDQESYALATNHIFALAALVFFISAAIIWLAPRPMRMVDPSAAH